jgi:hypothetical protein
VPADPSSPIPAALTHLTHTNPLQLPDADAPQLLTYLAAVPDPRAVRGRRHRLVAILAMAAAAVLAGARSITAIAEWAAEAPQPIRAALGGRRDAPDHFAVPAEATIRRTLARLDAAALAAAVGAWLADRERDRLRPAASRWRAVAVNGKTLRGARTQTAGGDGRPAHLLAAMDHTSPRGAGPMPGRRRPRGGPRVPATAGRARPGRDGDHRRCAPDPPAGRRVPSRRQARPLPVSGHGQPADPAGPLHRPALAPRPRVGPHCDRGHGRIEHRTLRAVTVHHFGFPTPPRSSRSPASARSVTSAAAPRRGGGRP